jgi:hypothetical protein
MSAPAVTGSIALLQQAQPILRIWPEGVRALLFAGAELNIPVHSGTTTTGAAVANAPNTWWRDVSLGNDGFDGAGALDIAETLRIAEKRWGNAADRGWDIGLLRDGSFVNGQFKRTYRFTAPPRATRAKVALAWNSTATARGVAPATLYASVLDLDLDVRVYDESGLVVGRSVSYDNSYEIVDFTPTPGKTYTIKVRRFSGPPAAWSWFGIAWAAR